MTEPLLLPYQTRAIAGFKANSLTVIEKSRRIGITWAFALEAAASISEPGAVDFHYLPPAEDLSLKFIEDAAKHAEMIGILLGDPELIDDDDITAFRIKCKSTGKSIYGHSGNPRRVRGHGGNVLIDEAALHDDLDETEAAANALTMWGGSRVIVSTHKGAQNKFNRLCDLVRGGGRGPNAHVIRTTLSDALDEGLYKRICRESGKEWSQKAQDEWERDLRMSYGSSGKEELDVIPQEGGIDYLPRPIIEQNMVLDGTVKRLSLDGDFSNKEDDDRRATLRSWFYANVFPVLDEFDDRRASYIGQDFGRFRDLTAICVGQDRDDGGLTCPLIVELANCPSVDQEWMIEEIRTHLPRFGKIVLDATGGGQTLGENLVRKWGESAVEAVKIAQSHYTEHMPKLKRRLQERQLDMVRDAEVMDDLRMVTLENGVPKVPSNVRKGVRHGDTAIALMHFVMAAGTASVIAPHQSTGRRVSMGAFDRGNIETSTGFGVVRSRRIGLGGF